MREIDYCDLIETNISLIFRDLLYEKAITCNREFNVRSGKVDFYVCCEGRRNYFVECKYIHGKSHNNTVRNGLVQLLEYKIAADMCNISCDVLCLFVNKTDEFSQRIIDLYNLPILIKEITVEELELMNISTTK